MDVRLAVTSGPSGLRNFPIKEFPCQIGRSEKNPVCLGQDPYVSSTHCQLDWDGRDFWLKDLNSSNGTYVNGTLIEQPISISLKKSTICIGKTRLLLITGEQMTDDERKKAALANLLAPDSILVPSSKILQEQKTEESLLVIDICESSHIATHHGENVLLKVVYLLGEILTKHSEANEVQFLKCTGDGFFVTFQETKNALRAACKLQQDLQTLIQKEKIFTFSIRMAVHQGNVTVDKTGDRLGVACHLVFRLQEAKIESRISAPEGVEMLPEEDRILLTDEAIYSLGEHMAECFSYIGDFMFKGFDYPVRANLLIEDTKTLLEKLS